MGSSLTNARRDQVTLLILLVRHYASPERTLSLGARGMIFLVLLSTMFASVHQVYVRGKEGQSGRS